MFDWQPATRQQMYRLALLSLALAVVGASAIAVAATSADGQTSVEMDGLDVADVNRTISGNVTDVTLSADLSYSHDIADTEQRIIKLKAGPSEEELSTISYVVARDAPGTDSGTVTLTGSLLEADGLTASDLDPALASTNETDVVVQAVVEIERADGEVVRRTVMDTAVIRLTDDGELAVSIGGSGGFSVKTDG